MYNVTLLYIWIQIYAQCNYVHPKDPTLFQNTNVTYNITQ